MKSIALGAFIITIWLAAFILLNNIENKSNPNDTSSKEQITFVETLTIDYEGDTTKI
ncbi:MAG: hypothetical protein ACJAU2_000859 [Maribacter sp.]|jgi:hypothetical protein